MFLFSLRQEKSKQSEQQVKLTLQWKLIQTIENDIWPLLLCTSQFKFLIFVSEIVWEIVEQQSMAEFCQTKEGSSAARSTTAGVVFHMFYY